MQKINRLWEKYGFICLFLVSSVMVFYKCHLGFAWWDEAFYLSIPYRLVQGDAMIVDEWHLSQLSGFLLYPMMKLWMAIRGNLDGIILAARYFYTIVSAVVAIFMYCRLRKQSITAAIICAIDFYLYVPYGIMALSYNTMGLIFMAISAILLFTMEKRIPLQCFLSGVCFACAVLCCPLLILVYVYAWILVFAKHKNKKEFMLWNAGILLMAIIFFAFVLSRATVKDILISIPYILEDPEHNLNYTLLDYFKQYFKFIIFHTRFTPALYAVYAVLCIGICVDKKRYEHRSFYNFMIILLTGLLFIQILLPLIQLNYMMFPFAIAGLPLFLLYGSRSAYMKNVMLYMWIPGLLFSFGISITSNLAFAAISSAGTIMSLASVCMIYEVKNTETDKVSGPVRVLTRLGVIGCAAFFMLVLFALRYRTVTWEEGPGAQNKVITDGCEKGLHVPGYAYDEYYQYRAVTAELRQQSKDCKLLFITKRTWMYLDNPSRCGSYSAWFISPEKMYEFYDLHPDMKPDIIFVDKRRKNMPDINFDEICEYFGFRMIENECGFILEE